ncbi:MAG: hypothetical protein MHM6MM_001954 [Cercozoa sp. M6MM]
MDEARRTVLKYASGAEKNLVKHLTRGIHRGHKRQAFHVIREAVARGEISAKRSEWSALFQLKFLPYELKVGNKYIEPETLQEKLDSVTRSLQSEGSRLDTLSLNVLLDQLLRSLGTLRRVISPEERVRVLELVHQIREFAALHNLNDISDHAAFEMKMHLRLVRDADELEELLPHALHLLKQVSKKEEKQLQRVHTVNIRRERLLLRKHRQFVREFRGKVLTEELQRLWFRRISGALDRFLRENPHSSFSSLHWPALLEAIKACATRVCTSDAQLASVLHKTLASTYFDVNCVPVVLGGVLAMRDPRPFLDTARAVFSYGMARMKHGPFVRIPPHFFRYANDAKKRNRTSAVFRMRVSFIDMCCIFGKCADIEGLRAFLANYGEFLETSRLEATSLQALQSAVLLKHTHEAQDLLMKLLNKEVESHQVAQQAHALARRVLDSFHEFAGPVRQFGSPLMREQLREQFLEDKSRASDPIFGALLPTANSRYSSALDRTQIVCIQKMLHLICVAEQLLRIEALAAPPDHREDNFNNDQMPHSMQERRCTLEDTATLLSEFELDLMSNGIFVNLIGDTALVQLLAARGRVASAFRCARAQRLMGREESLLQQALRDRADEANKKRFGYKKTRLQTEHWGDELLQRGKKSQVAHIVKRHVELKQRAFVALRAFLQRMVVHKQHQQQQPRSAEGKNRGTVIVEVPVFGGEEDEVELLDDAMFDKAARNALDLFTFHSPLYEVLRGDTHLAKKYPRFLALVEDCRQLLMEVLDHSTVKQSIKHALELIVARGEDLPLVSIDDEDLSFSTDTDHFHTALFEQEMEEARQLLADLIVASELETDVDSSAAQNDGYGNFGVVDAFDRDSIYDQPE